MEVLMSRVRFGVVGAGSVALRGILPHLTQDDVQDKLQVTAVCDSFPGRAAAASENFGVPHFYEDYEEMLSDGQVDAVSIATPIPLHYEQGRLAIDSGVHVHFNKTMTTTVAEADDLIASAARKDVKLVASPGEMLRPIYQEIRTLLVEGALGRLVWSAAGSVFGEYHEKETVRLEENISPAWYFRKPGGGPLYDMTVYNAHRMTGILGPVERVTALSGLRLKEREFRGERLPCDMDDNTFMLLDFGGGVFGFLYGAAAGVNTEICIYGTGGSIEKDRINGLPIGASRVPPRIEGIHHEIEELQVYADIMELVDWIREDKPTIVSAQHARHVIEIFEAAYRSAQTGETQRLKTTF